MRCCLCILTAGSNTYGYCICGRRFDLFPRKGVSIMSVMEILTLLLLITNIVALVVPICNNNRKNNRPPFQK